MEAKLKCYINHWRRHILSYSLDSCLSPYHSHGTNTRKKKNQKIQKKNKRNNSQLEHVNKQHGCTTVGNGKRCCKEDTFFGSDDPYRECTILLSRP
jgi:hypothetical protein